MGLQRVRHNLATVQQQTTIEKDKHYVSSHSLTHTYAHTENLHNVICQLYLNKAEGKRIEELSFYFMAWNNSNHINITCFKKKKKVELKQMNHSFVMTFSVVDIYSLFPSPFLIINLFNTSCSVNFGS